MTSTPSQAPQAIILAAGLGTRLGDGNDYLPKTLLRLGGITLLERQVAAIRRVLRISAITVVVGHEADKVREVGGPDLRYVENEEYRNTNTADSLRRALEFDGSGALLLNGDVLFSDSALAALDGVESGGLCEYKPHVVDEEVQVHVDDAGRITRIGKAIAGVAEAVGMYRLGPSLNAAYLAEYRGSDARSYYEDVVNRLVGNGHDFQAVPLPAGAVATEIDTPEDLERARGLVSQV
jgi:L-glutamine-phosphate cytidylyltransferase